jgi:2'-5' RNA ligase
LSLDLGDAFAEPALPTMWEKDSVFFATLPEPPLALGMRRFAGTAQRRFGLTGRLRPPATLHITLLGLGRRAALSDAVLDRARRAASAVRMPHFRVGLDRMKTFDNGAKHPLVLCGGDNVAGLHALHDALGTALAAEGLQISAPSYDPHATVLYGAQRVAETALDEPFDWIVKRFVLVHSHYGESRYDVLGDWPLLGPVSRA